MATATCSITDSTAQDDIPEKPHHPVSNTQIWAKESSLPFLPICLVWPVAVTMTSLYG